MKEWCQALGATALILFTPGCATKTYTVVDENGTPIEGAWEAPGIPFKSKASGKEGKIKIHGDFAQGVDAADYEPVFLPGPPGRSRLPPGKQIVLKAAR